MQILNFILSLIMAFSGGASTLYGTAITTIQGSDQISASRTTINNNFQSLLTGKEEISDLVSTTSLPGITTLPALASVGTITTGIWHGTTITTANGGTGSTTLASNQVLLGNATGNIGIVSGFGTAGQALVSNGTNVAPTFQSISFNNALNYTLTGAWTFTATTTIAASSTTANPLVLDGLPYSFPTTRGASSTVAEEDGNGNITFEIPQDYVIAANSQLNSGSNSTGTTTLAVVTLPPNTFSSKSMLRITEEEEPSNTGAICGSEIDIGTGSATGTIAYPVMNNFSGSSDVMIINESLFATSSSAVSGDAVWNFSASGGGLTVSPGVVKGLNTANNIYLGFAVRSANSGTTCYIDGYSVEVVHT